MKSNSKIVQGALIVAVIAIWAIIGYRVYTAMSDDVETLPTTYVPETIQVDQEHSKEMELRLDYKNPFTGKRPPQKRNPKPNTTPSIVAPIIIPEIVKPNIVYKGYSFNDSGERRVAIMLDNQLKFLKPMQAIDGVRLVSAEKNILTISYQNKLFKYER